MPDASTSIPRKQSDLRPQSIALKWNGDNSIGRLTIGGKLWASVEWSEKRQRWCVEDSEGRCLTHRPSIHGMAASRDEAVALAKAMIVDGRMPSPEAAKAARAEYEQRQQREQAERRKKREQQPAQIRKREEKAEALRRWGDAHWAARTAEKNERQMPALYETLANVFNLSDPELWKSNSFASLRPRLVAHVQAVVAKLVSDIAWAAMNGPTQPFMMYATTEQRKNAAAERQARATREIEDLQRKLDRAREILASIEAGS
jgi:hypothetical protein